MSNTIQMQPDPLEVKHRSERLSRDYGLKLTAEYFAAVHDRSIQRIYDAWAGKAKSLLRKMDKHLDVVEERCKRKSEQMKQAS